MKYILDTNICIYIIKQKPYWVKKKFEALNIGDVGVSSITISELFYGVYKSKRIEQNRETLIQFLMPLEICEFGYKASIVYGQIRAQLEKTGNTIGPLDMLIAAHTKSIGVVLVTNNIKEFEKVDGLHTENWI